MQVSVQVPLLIFSVLCPSPFLSSIPLPVDKHLFPVRGNYEKASKNMCIHRFSSNLDKYLGVGFLVHMVKIYLAV